MSCYGITSKGIIMSKKLAIYLAGGMENDKNLGAGWRDKVTPSLLELGFAILNPCEFEPDQLKGLHTSRLPDKLKTEEGKNVKPKHWHHLKQAPRDSSYYLRFKKYMQRIIKYDLSIIKEEVDIVICYWTKATAKGAGTHSELTYAFINNIPVFVVLEPGTELPGWIHGCTTKIFDTFDELQVDFNKYYSKEAK